MTPRVGNDRVFDNEKTATYLESVEKLRRTALDYCRKTTELDSTTRDQEVIEIVTSAQKLYAMYFYFSVENTLKPKPESITSPGNGILRRFALPWAKRKRDRARNDNQSVLVRSQPRAEDVDFVRIAAGALTQNRELSRWSSQCLAHFAFYTDLLHKLHVFRDNAASFPKHPEATAFLSLRASVSQADIRNMAEACKMLTGLNDLSSENKETFRDIAYDWAIGKNKDLSKAKRPLSPELAIMNACLSNWIYKLKDNGDQGLNAIWMPSLWLPVGGNAGEQRQPMLVYLTVKNSNVHKVGYVAAQDREYVLSITSKEISQYNLITDESGRAALLDDGDVEIEWQLNVPNSILMGRAERSLNLTVVCYGFESPPIYQELKLRVCEREKASPDASQCQDDEFGFDSLNSTTNGGTQMRERILLDGLTNAIRKAFGVPDNSGLDNLGILIDARCGRFLREAVANQVELAKALIKQTIEAMIQDGWWYVSRPQIEKAIEQLVSPTPNLGINPLVNQYIDQCLDSSTVIRSGLPHEHAKLVLLEVCDLYRQGKPVTITAVVDRSLRSKHDKLRRDSVNFPGIFAELVRSGLLRESKGCYEFANGFVKSWVTRQNT